MGKSSYSGTLRTRIQAEIFDQNGKLIERESYDRNLGSIPVMVRVWNKFIFDRCVYSCAFVHGYVNRVFFVSFVFFVEQCM
jgi:hypothetical protein